MHGSLEEFEIQPDLSSDCGVSCLRASEKIPIGGSHQRPKRQSSHIFAHFLLYFIKCCRSLEGDHCSAIYQDDRDELFSSPEPKAHG